MKKLQKLFAMLLTISMLMSICTVGASANADGVLAGDGRYGVQKVWDDNNNAAGVRPDSVTVELYANDAPTGKTAVLTAENDWAYTWDNLDVNKKYHVVEKEIPVNYEATSEQVGEVPFTVSDFDRVTRCNEKEITVPEKDSRLTCADFVVVSLTNSVDVFKKDKVDFLIWTEFELSEASKTSILNKLDQDGEALFKKANQENTVFLYNDGPNPYSEYVKFEKVGNEICGTSIKATSVWQQVLYGTGSVTPGYTVLTNTCSMVDVSVEKVWDDANDKDGMRPDSVTINLLANDVATGKSLSLNADNNWTGVFSNLPQYAAGNEIAYTISEVEVDEYTTEITGSVAAGFTVTNSHTPATVDIPVAKSWEDADNQDGKRPDSVTINLLANDAPVADKSLTLNAENNWSGTFEGLDGYDTNGNAIVYTISEVEVDEYTTEITGSVAGGFVVTNSHTPETIDIEGSKTWNDNDDQDGMRPDEITIRVWNGSTQVTSKKVTAADGWAWEFTGLPKYADGVEIVYAITEDDVPNYSEQVNGYDVTNSYTPGTVTVSGHKTWNDNDGQYGTRPDEITIRVWNGSTQVASKKVTAADGWAWEFTGLPEYAAGKAIRYTITEDEVDGYDSVVCGYNVTNTPNEGTLTINKRVAGEPGFIPKIPGETAFIVKDESGKTVETVYYKDFEDGSYTIKGLRVGTYTVTEDYDSAQVKGYKLTVEGGPTAKAEVTVGGNAYVGFTNNYELVPYTYKVVHEFYTSLNDSDPTRDGANAAKEYSAKTTPRMQEVFDAQDLNDVYTGNNATYERKATYAETEISAVGTLRGGDRVYTIKYYRSDWTTGSLTIEKTISGDLDFSAEKKLKGALSFTVTGPDNYNETISYSDNMTLTGLTPGTYTVVENNAEVAGYDLTVTAPEKNQIEVTAGASSAVFEIENDYTGRVYNIWFDGGDHGNVEDGVYRNRWQKFHGDKKEGFAWGGRVLNPTVGDKPSDTIYELDDRYDPKTYIYKTVTEDTDYTIDEILAAAKNNTDGMVMYTLTSAQWAKYSEEMDFSYGPALSVDTGWVSDKEFYHNGGSVAFESLEKTLKVMNDYIDGVAAVNEDDNAVLPVYEDDNGFYHIYYVAKYSQYKTPTGSLTINKTATGAEVPAGATFTITGTTIDNEAYTTSFTYQDMTDGSKTITVPAGEYSVTETNAGISGYTLTVTGNENSVSVTEGGTAMVNIVNTYTQESTGGNDGGTGGSTGGGFVYFDETPVPLAPMPEIPAEPDLEEILDEEVPLADVPKTGDASALWLALSALSGASLAGVSFLGRKKREED